MVSLFDRTVDEIQLDLLQYVLERGDTLEHTKEQAIQRLLPALRKRYIGKTRESSLTEEERSLKTRTAFLSDNRRCDLLNHTWEGRKSLRSFATDEILSEAKTMLYDFFHPGGVNLFDDSKMLVQLAAGPGGSAEHESDLSFYQKMGQSNLSASSNERYAYYKLLVKRNPLTYYTEKYRYGEYGASDVTDALPMYSDVPKNDGINREIIKHATVDMSLQLAIHGIISERAVQYGWFNLETQQDHNRYLAFLGSCNLGTGGDPLCTMDLKSASNYPIELAREMLPEIVFELCDFTQADTIDMGDGTTITKHMFSNMGCGFTFAIMTTILTAIVKATYKCLCLPTTLDSNSPVNGLIPARARGNKAYAVFGDDIIVVKSAYDQVREVLVALGFIVNDSKSYSEGLFRESCGHDYYDGYWVRPVYCETLSSKQDCTSLFNRLTVWGSYHGVPLNNTLKFLYAMSSKLHVPNTEDCKSGIHVPEVLRPKDFSNHLKRVLGSADGEGFLYRADIPRVRTKRIAFQKRKTIFLSDVGPQPLIWQQCLKQSVVEDEVFRGATKHQGKTNIFCYLLGILGGYIRDGAYSVRNNGDVLYDCEVLFNPGWGDKYHFHAGRPLGSAGCSYEDWEVYVVSALT